MTATRPAAWMLAAYPESNIPKYVFRKSGQKVHVIESNPTCKRCAKTKEAKEKTAGMSIGI
ncbi:MAG TPA: hypothetical protein VGS27_21700 [Candidatus Sulfotelmatobacter sp.]|nr:hypothetical protein [Candidatus Sulfotelmatobacter sp.]